MAKEFFVKSNRYKATFYFDPAVFCPIYESLEKKLGGLIAGGFCIGGELSLYSRGKITLYFNPTYQKLKKRKYAIEKMTKAIKEL